MSEWEANTTGAYYRPGQTLVMPFYGWDPTGKKTPKVGDFFTQHDPENGSLRVTVIAVDEDARRCTLQTADAFEKAE
jgi:hypothetical protein